MLKRTVSYLVLLACAASVSAAGNETPSREHLAPPGMEAAYHDWHYTPVLKVGDMVIVSGIPAGRGADYEEKIENMFVALKAHLASAGAEMSDVVELTSFHVLPKDDAAFREEFARFAPIHHRHFPDHYPAWSAVGTTALLAPGAVVELRAVAVIGSGKQPRANIPQPQRRPPPKD
ncbi:Rid family hydrolase [Pseudomarimonas salicorniae]|uniref:Rid family hydrolase n=1 Tax=Pseudomarimonas salicorniae TaxID=2933270 RepID=A0ABT0GDS7_9GAMM|nr:Rid family hydrolase [Lysobacter sp. CAU 1642]MCK7592700.1 Rid family hydrolase [Lysobacter sp. CAU 1642]